MRSQFLEHLAGQVSEMRTAGTLKPERVIQSGQGARVRIADNRQVLNLCANNYLGLAGHPEVIRAAQAGLDRWGFGCASVRFICGTQSVHKQLEDQLSDFLGKAATILYNSCWDANGGLFETVLTAEDAIISDELNHASIIDGIRLCKAQRFRYRNNDMDDLRARLQEAKDARFRLIATDGVFSMDGYLANLPDICQLADEYDALVMVDDSHAVGFMGKQGRGTHEHHHVMERVDILTGTLGKALGGASGGYTAGPAQLVDLLRQRSRTYLFSNTLAPSIAAGTLKAIEILRSSARERDTLMSSTRYFRERLSKTGLQVLPGEHPIVPIILGHAGLAAQFASAMLERGIYVVGFSYPVVPLGKARIRTQISAAHTVDDLDRAIQAIEEVAVELKIV